MDKNMRRIGIFVFYDKYGVVDSYIVHLLEHMKRFLEQLIIICNGKVEKAGIEQLKKYSARVHVRENKGFDAMAFKKGMIDICGWQELEEYDEIVLFNDTFFGPIDSFEDMFSKMSYQEIDFWGITSHPQTKFYPAHIQSYFMAFKRNVVQNEKFRNYWENIDFCDKDVLEVISLHETQLTRLCEEWGFSWGVYVDLNEEEEYQGSNPYGGFADDLVIKHRWPIVKKKVLSNKTTMMRKDVGKNIINYLEEHTSYNVDMIYENLIRTTDLHELQETMNWFFGIQGDREFANEAACICFIGKDDKLQEVVEAYEIENVYYFDNLEQVVSKKDVFSEYEMVCVLDMECLHDYANEETPIGKMLFRDARNEIINGLILGSKEVYALFCDNTRLGLLTIPEKGNVTYQSNVNFLDRGWDKHFGIIQKFLNRNSLYAPIAEKSRCVRTRGLYWARCRKWLEFLELLKNEEEQEIIQDRGLTFFFQTQGFYSGEIISSNYAKYLYAEAEKNMDFIANRYREMLSCNFHIFCEKYDEIYVYGAGLVGETVTKILESENIKIAGLIVTDGKSKETTLNYKVYFLSEVSDISEKGIIVAVGKQWREEVLNTLREKNIGNLLCYI